MVPHSLFFSFLYLYFYFCICVFVRNQNHHIPAVNVDWLELWCLAAFFCCFSFFLLLHFYIFISIFVLVCFWEIKSITYQPWMLIGWSCGASQPFFWKLHFLPEVYTDPTRSVKNIDFSFWLPFLFWIFFGLFSWGVHCPNSVCWKY